MLAVFFFFQAEDGIRDFCLSRGLGDVYKRQLRFSTELKDAKKEALRVVSTKGPGVFANYSIHQVEMIVTLLGAEAQRVMAVGTPQCPALAIGFSGGRYATMGQFGDGCPFSVSASYDDGSFLNIPECSDYFPTVSYTHLTLPTNREVSISVGAG